MPEIHSNSGRYNSSVRVCDANGTHIFRAPSDVACRLVTMGAAIPNTGKRIWKITLARPPINRIGDTKAPSIHHYKTAAPVFRETLGDGDQQWRSQTYAFKQIGADLVERLLAERVDQGFVHHTAPGYVQNLGDN